MARLAAFRLTLAGAVAAGGGTAVSNPAVSQPPGRFRLGVAGGAARIW